MRSSGAVQLLRTLFVSEPSGTARTRKSTGSLSSRSRSSDCFSRIALRHAPKEPWFRKSTAGSRSQSPARGHLVSAGALAAVSDTELVRRYANPRGGADLLEGSLTRRGSERQAIRVQRNLVVEHIHDGTDDVASVIRNVSTVV